MTPGDLEQLSKEDLIKIIMMQAQQLAEYQVEIAAMREEFKKLKADYEALKMKFEKHQKPPTSSKNSSQPPSKDQKVNKDKGKHRHKHGSPFGHEKHEREFVAQADHILNIRKDKCSCCDTDLSSERGELIKVNQITEIPEAKAQVIEVRQYQVVCPKCQEVQIEKPPEGLDMERTFGSRLEALVVYYRQEQHMSYKRTQLALLYLHGITISQGGIDNIMQRAGNQAILRAKSIEKDIKQSKVIHSDETSSRVMGDNWWEWVFWTKQSILHIIRHNRSVDVIRDVMGTSVAEVWVCDCYGAQLNAPAWFYQLCLAHQLRNLQAVVDACPTQTWARAMQVLFRYAIHLHHQRHILSSEQFFLQLARIENHCDRLLQRSLDSPDANRLKKRYLKHRQKLFVFLYRSDVEPTNNVSERALRPSVIHRKVTGCFRSDWGAKAYAALASVIDTAELNGINAFQAIQSLFPVPALPIPIGGE
jgi:transposase